MLQGDIAYLREVNNAAEAEAGRLKAVLHRALNCLDAGITTVQADPYSPPEPATPWDLEAAQIVTDLVRDPRGGGEMSYPFSRTSSWVGPGSHALAQAQADGYRQGVEAALSASDLERIGRRLAPEVVRALADYLELVDAPCRSEVLLHHGPGGIVGAAEGRRVTKILDVRAPKSVPSI